MPNRDINTTHTRTHNIYPPTTATPSLLGGERTLSLGVRGMRHLNPVREVLLVDSFDQRRFVGLGPGQDLFGVAALVPGVHVRLWYEPVLDPVEADHSSVGVAGHDLADYLDTVI